MSSYDLRLSSEAERYIEEQMQWYEADQKNGGAELADRWLDLLETALDALTGRPGSHSFASENGRRMPEFSIRQLRFKPWRTSSAWRILYLMDEASKMVTVLQVRHERRPLLPETGS